LSAGYIKAWKTYVADVLRAIGDAEPDLLAVLMAIDIRNESAVYSDQKPFSLTGGRVTLGDGRTYDMGNAESRQLAADNNAISSTNQIVIAIKAVDSQILTTASVFSPAAVHRQGYDGVQPNDDPRAPLRVRALESSNIDFISLDVYPQDPGMELEDHMRTCELAGAVPGGKPRVMLEFGAFKQFFRTLSDAVIAMEAFQIQSCTDFGFQGWFLWTWDSPDPEQGMLWSERDGLGAALAEIARPDACSASFARRGLRRPSRRPVAVGSR
jgi:hypothetical protein